LEDAALVENFRYDSVLMDFNTLLLWMAGASCLVNVIQASRPSPKLWGWIFVSITIAAVGGLADWFRPDIAGYIAGAMWAVFALVPALAQRSTRRWTAQQKYERAARSATIVGILHPFDGAPQTSKLLRALSLAEQGRIETAVGMLKQLETTAPAHIARSAAVQARRFSQDWHGLIAWVQTHIDARKLPSEHNILPLYIRAMGETGQLGTMLGAAAQSRLSMHPQMSVFRSMCRLYTFAFCGQPAQVAETFNGSLSLLPATVQQYWIATANYAAGMTEAAADELRALQHVAEPGLVRSIEHRVANPPRRASEILTAGDIAILDQPAVDQEHDRLFSHAPGRGWRPWVTFSLVLANVLMFAAEWVGGARPGNWLNGGTMDDAVLRRLGSMNGYVLQTHEYYRLFLANFLHYGYAHITMNMLALLILGPYVELSLGRMVYLLLYLISGVCVMVTVLFLQLHHLMEELVGASGAIMAIIGATIAILLRGWYRERAAAASRRLQMLATIIVIQVVFDHFTPEVSGAAHIAGIAWGFVLASLLPHRKRSTPKRGFLVRLNPAVNE
jgi:rhomboid protease GluP